MIVDEEVPTDAWVPRASGGVFVEGSGGLGHGLSAGNAFEVVEVDDRIRHQRITRSASASFLQRRSSMDVHEVPRDGWAPRASGESEQNTGPVFGFDSVDGILWTEICTQLGANAIGEVSQASGPAPMSWPRFLRSARISA